MAEEPADAAQEVVPLVVVATEEVGTLVAFAPVSVGKEEEEDNIITLLKSSSINSSDSSCGGGDDDNASSSSCASVAESGNEAALGCNAETLCKPHSVLFTELPDLVSWHTKEKPH